MKPNIIANGDWNWRRWEARQSRLRELRVTIRTRYAEAWAKAGFFQRWVLRWRMSTEFRNERRKIVPSSQSLYSNQATDISIPDQTPKQTRRERFCLGFFVGAASGFLGILSTGRGSIAEVAGWILFSGLIVGVVGVLFSKRAFDFLVEFLMRFL